jgi:hypothetical protein
VTGTLAMGEPPPFDLCAAIPETLEKGKGGAALLRRRRRSANN